MQGRTSVALGLECFLFSFLFSLPFFAFKIASHSLVQQTGLELAIILLTKLS